MTIDNPSASLAQDIPTDAVPPGAGEVAALIAPAPMPEANPENAGKGANAEGDDQSVFAEVVSGEFDVAQEAAPDDDSEPGKRVLLPQSDSPKLHKVLAQAGIGSRLEMEQLILEGRITVNNEPAHIGQRIQFGDHVKVNGKPIRFRIDPPAARVIAYHKPAGEVVTHDDPQNRPTVFRRLPKLHQGKWQSVGRLDLNTEGLLLFTSSGALANNLMHPRFGLEREYAVRVLGSLSREEKQKLLDGVTLDDGPARFGSIVEGGGEGSNCWYRVTISEGRNREVRRMIEAVGHAVSRLIRIRYGAMVLPRGLKRGAWMELDESDIRLLAQAAGAGDAGRAHARPPRGGAGLNAVNGEGDDETEIDDDDDNRGNTTEVVRGPRHAQRNGQNNGLNNGQRQPAGARFGDSANGRGNRRRGARPANGPGPRGGNAAAADQSGNPGGPRRPAGPGNGGNGGNRIGRPPQTGRDDRNNRMPRDDSGDHADRQAAASQPDPMKTSLGYIGADSFTRQRQGQGQGQRRGGGGSGGGGGGGAFGGGQRPRGPGTPGGAGAPSGAGRRGGRRSGGRGPGGTGGIGR